MIILHWKHIFAINFYYHFNFVINSCITTIVKYIVNTWQLFIFCLSSVMIFVCTKCTLLRCVYAGHYAPWMPPFTLGPLNIPLDLLGPHSSPVLPYKLLEYPSNVAVDPRGSWLPYSTYLYLDFHLLCSMTKLKEHSREICYPRGPHPLVSPQTKSTKRLTLLPSLPLVLFQSIPNCPLHLADLSEPIWSC